MPAMSLANCVIHAPKYTNGRSQQYPFDIAKLEGSVQGVDPVDVELSSSQVDWNLLIPRVWEAEHASICLHKCYDFWANELGVMKPILEIIKHGYYLPLIYAPNSYSSPNHKLAFCIRVLSMEKFVA